MGGLWGVCQGSPAIMAQLGTCQGRISRSACLLMCRHLLLTRTAWRRPLLPFILLALKHSSLTTPPFRPTTCSCRPSTRATPPSRRGRWPASGAASAPPSCMPSWTGRVCSCLPWMPRCVGLAACCCEVCSRPESRARGCALGWVPCLTSMSPDSGCLVGPEHLDAPHPVPAPRSTLPTPPLITARRAWPTCCGA